MSETYKPTSAMASAAKKALKIRDAQPESNKGMTSVGLTRARQLISGESLSLETVKRMYSFFSRHEVDKKGEGWGKDSKGYQAWLGWGGDAGYSWSKAIVKKSEANNMLELEEVKNKEVLTMNKVLLQTNVSKSMIVSTDTHFKIKGIPITVNEAVMNGVLYPADENERGMNSLVGKPLTIGHPQVNGEFVSGQSGKGLQDHFSGGTIDTVYEVNNVWMVDATIKKDVLQVQSNELYQNLENKKPMPVSTGLMFEQNEISGVNHKGEQYQKVAKEQQFDHLAALLNERPAGGDSTIATFNSENIAIVNIEEHLPQEDSIVNSVIKRVLHILKGNVYNDSDINVNEQNKVEIMTREESLELLGLNSDAEISDAALNSLVANMAKKGMDKTKVDDEDEDEEKMKAKKNKAYEKNSSDHEEVIALRAEVAELKAAVNSKQDEQLEKDAKTLGLSVNTLKLMPEDERKTLIANQAKAGVNFAANGEKPLEAVNGIQLKAHSF